MKAAFGNDFASACLSPSSILPERRQAFQLPEVMDAELPGPRLDEQPNLLSGPGHPLGEVPEPPASLLSQFSSCFSEPHERLVAHWFSLELNAHIDITQFLAW